MVQFEIHIVPDLPNPIRLQEYGVSIFQNIATKSALKKVLKKQLITVNQTIATTATFIKGGECIQLVIEAPTAPKRKLDLSLNVLFEDNYMAAIEKPAGILVSGNHFKTIVNGLNQNLRPSELPDATGPQPVHRLDYATTGILLIGKTSSSIRELNKLFANKSIQKTYYAIAIGAMSKKGEINFNIDNKISSSEYVVLDSVSSERFKRLNLVLLKPKTGRRHQLRKHLSQLGNSILGDVTYSPESLILKGKGLYLHAYSLEFEHPFTKKHMLLESKLPKKFEKIFGAIQY